jgi:hypothetical protein
LAQAGIGAYEIEDNLKVGFLSNQKARTISEDLIEKILFTYGGEKNGEDDESIIFLWTKGFKGSRSTYSGN